MTEIVFAKIPDDDEEHWTAARLADELCLNLASVKEKIYNAEGIPVTVHKYYHQAREKMKWIPITKGKGRMVFIIHISELTPRLKKELENYYNDAGEKAFTRLLKESVGKLFENLDFNYYHISVMKYLTVRFIK
jgi:hypothetical protein